MSKICGYLLSACLWLYSDVIDVHSMHWLSGVNWLYSAIQV